jgi:hypothetical protein
VKPKVKGLKPAEQRRAAVAEIRADLNRDVGAIQAVANAPPTAKTWSDVLPDGDEKQKTPLINEIRNRIIAGEAQVKAQDLESLAN